jgi:Anaphase-promoting complex, subunit 10 (APC10)
MNHTHHPRFLYLREQDYLTLQRSRLLISENRVDGKLSILGISVASNLVSNGIDSSGIIKAFLVQISIIANHQNGKDTHLRGVKIFAPGTEYSTHASTSLEGPWLDEEQNRMFSIR